MIYSLPNGKIIHLTIEEYLDLTDQDIQFLMGINAGEYSTGPWYDSSILNNKTVSDKMDKSIDYIPEDDEKLLSDGISLDNTSEDLVDLPDEDLE